MKRWFNKVAVVTGASSGIGASTVLELVKSGLVVVGLARRQHRVEDLKSELPESLRKNLHAIKCDISKEEEILSTFAEIEKKFGGVDVLVNNAGINRITSLIDSKNSEPIREVVDTNLMGLVFCTREAVQSMQKRNVAGHVIHINSIAGHYVPNVAMIDFSLNVYPATKHGVTALTETLRQDLNKMKSQIKITSISPGGVRTEIIPKAMIQQIDDGLVECPLLESVDVAEAVVYVLSTSPRVQVHELIIKPIGEIA